MGFKQNANPKKEKKVHHTHAYTQTQHTYLFNHLDFSSLTRSATFR